MSAYVVVTIGDSMYIVSGWQAFAALGVAMLAAASILMLIGYALAAYVEPKRQARSQAAYRS